jgi:hypothetical protein
MSRLSFCGERIRLLSIPGLKARRASVLHMGEMLLACTIVHAEVLGEYFQGFSVHAIYFLLDYPFASLLERG